MQLRRLVVLAILLTAVAAPTTAAARPEAAIVGVRSAGPGINHACAVLSNGQVRCWGADNSGDLGNGAGGSSPTPVTVLNEDGNGPLTDVVQVVSGTDFSCARLGSGQARCWGNNNTGQLGNGISGGTAPLPAVVLGVTGSGPLTNIAQLSAGGSFACAALTGGQVRCWGLNDVGQLGDGTTDPAARPIVVRNPADTGPLTQVTQVAVATFGVCARLSTGQARCWGSNGSGQVGDGGTSERHLPTVVRSANGTGALANVVEVVEGNNFACARLTNGQVRCWGGNGSGQLGDGTITTTPFPAPVQTSGGDGNLTGVAQIDAGDGTFVCARLTNRQVRCWGQGANGQIGDGDSVTRRLPTAVRNVSDTGSLGNVTSVVVGTSFACARLATAQLRCWGANGSFQLGDTTNTNRPTPVVVVAGS